MRIFKLNVTYRKNYNCENHIDGRIDGYLNGIHNLNGYIQCNINNLNSHFFFNHRECCNNHSNFFCVELNYACIYM